MAKAPKDVSFHMKHKVLNPHMGSRDCLHTPHQEALTRRL